jgi:pyrroline-5-carboxylate reductase
VRSVAFLGGGNMAEALIRGLISAKQLSPSLIRVSDVKPERLAALHTEHGVTVFDDNAALVRGVDVVVLSVKPQAMDKILEPLAQSLEHEHSAASRPLIISVAAGVPLRAIEARLPEGTHVVRAMPNTPATALAGATAIAPGTFATSADLAVAETFFAAVGKVVTLDESLLDAVTGLSGSGPAYVMLIIEALADGGVKVGLHRDTALMLAAQTVYGSAKLLLETGEHPGRLKDMVTSPGGTAIAGLHTLEAGGLRTTLINAVECATLRSETLGAQMAEKLKRR